MPNESFAPIDSELITESDYTDTDVVNGTTYYYVVTAVNESDFESSFSNEVSATPLDSPLPYDYKFYLPLSHMDLAINQ